MTTRRCPDCHRKFDVDPTVPRQYPDFPGYCDGCAATHEENKPDVLGNTIRRMHEGDSFLIPISPQYPHPLETIEAEIKRTRWTGLHLEVRRVHKGDTYSNGHVEPVNGVRVWMVPPPEEKFDKERWVQEMWDALRNSFLERAKQRENTREG